MQENDILSSIENNNLNNFSTLEKTKNIRIWNELTLEEKIDYIYKTLKFQKKLKNFKLFWKLFILIWLIYLFLFYIPSISQQKTDQFKSDINKFIATQVSQIAKPLVEEITKDMVKNISSPNDATLEETANKVLNWDIKVNSAKVEEFLKKHPELKDKFNSNN